MLGGNVYVITVYDISDVRIQGKLRNFLRRYLRQTQLSVYEGELTPAQFREIVEFTKSLNITDPDTFIIYKLQDYSRIDRVMFGKQFEKKNNII